mmetsp:Transcript_6698/g.13769  ORF Transcript_6698/g.13769 Transcript_6698/m.13769 type:complete len:444 (-) Transcript_6698:467-1798(-)
MLVADLINERCVETFAAAGRVVARRFHGHDPIVDAVDVGQSVFFKFLEILGARLQALHHQRVGLQRVEAVVPGTVGALAKHKTLFGWVCVDCRGLGICGDELFQRCKLGCRHAVHRVLRAHRGQRGGHGDGGLVGDSAAGSAPDDVDVKGRREGRRTGEALVSADGHGGGRHRREHRLLLRRCCHGGADCDGVPHELRPQQGLLVGHLLGLEHLRLRRFQSLGLFQSLLAFLPFFARRGRRVPLRVPVARWGRAAVHAPLHGKGHAVGLEPKRLGGVSGHIELCVLRGAVVDTVVVVDPRGPWVGACKCGTILSVRFCRREHVGVPHQVGLVRWDEECGGVRFHEAKEARVVRNAFRQEIRVVVAGTRHLPQEGTLALAGLNHVELCDDPERTRTPNGRSEAEAVPHFGGRHPLLTRTALVGTRRWVRGRKLRLGRLPPRAPW